MKIFTSQFVAIIVTVAEIKRSIELFIIHVTNKKPYKTVESIIISLAN